MPPGQMAKLSAHPVTDYGGPDTAAHDEADPRGLLYWANQEVPHNQRLSGTATTTDSGGELSLAPQPGSRGKHRQSPPRADAGQTLTRARPFRRLAARTARPARLRMRSRKPCVLARRRLFG
jgi:hypothetical protein